MDGSDEVVKASDSTLEPKKKSAYFDAYLSGKKLDSAMEADEFNDFIKYSALVAKSGTAEMLGGNITPSPVTDACNYCKMGGSCGFASRRRGVSAQSEASGARRFPDLSARKGGRRNDLNRRTARRDRQRGQDDSFGFGGQRQDIRNDSKACRGNRKRR